MIITWPYDEMDIIWIGMMCWTDTTLDMLWVYPIDRVHLINPFTKGD